MPVTDFTERSKIRALVLGGYLEDVEVSGSGHKASIVKTDGGSAFNVAACLSLLGVEVLFLSCFGVRDSNRWVFRSIPVMPDCAHGIFLFSGSDVIAVQKPKSVHLNQELVRMLIDEEYDLLYSTLEIGQQAASVISSVKARIKVVDPSPFHEFKGLDGLEQYDFILANDYMSIERRGSRVIVKASEKGVYFAGKDYLPPVVGKNRFGSGDIFGSVFSLLLVNGASPEEAIGEAVRVSGKFCSQTTSVEQFMLGIRSSLNYVKRG
ncbi:MAG: carbohydrate kinase family protein [Kosmotogaceae bacterium]|nr:carbohydrate kinase family protein [Kosmotogaceae bacterium]